MKIRSFIALPFSLETTTNFFELVKTLSRLEHFHKIRWLSLGNCHMTLSFLGNVKTEQLKLLVKNLDQSLSNYRAGFLRFNEVSPFPFNSRPRVIAALTEPSEWLKMLQNIYVQAARRSGIVLERRRFIPHVTLARLNSRKHNPPKLPKLFMGKETPIKNVVLFESVIHLKGAEYHVLETFGLE